MAKISLVNSSCVHLFLCNQNTICMYSKEYPVDTCNQTKFINIEIERPSPFNLCSKYDYTKIYSVATLFMMVE